MDINTRKKIGEKIRILREKIGFSQEQLAQKVGKQTATYIAFIEKGERNIATMDLMRIAKELGVSVAVLIGEEKPKKQTFVEALRSSSDLSASDRSKIEEYFNFIKKDKK